MAQQSARRDRDNQAATPYFEYATLIWTRSANSHAGRRSMAAQEAGQMAASDYAHGILMFSLALKGASTDVAWIGGVGALSPTRVPGYARRTYSGRPSSSIRFSASAAIATSLA